MLNSSLIAVKQLCILTQFEEGSEEGLESAMATLDNVHFDVNKLA
jgi:hypothetical protein